MTSHTQHPTPPASPSSFSLHPSAFLTMPRHDRDNEVLARVIADYGVSQQQLADATGISHSFISRVFAGQYAAPPALLRAIWNRTRDQRVARVALGDRVLDQIAERPTDPHYDQRQALVIQSAHAIGIVAEQLAKLAAGRGSSPALRAAMLDATRLMRTLDSHLQTAPPGGEVDHAA